MKRFVLNTKSESGDNYTYFIEHPNKPTSEELNKFLMEQGCDNDEEQTYEYVETLIELPTEFKKI